MPSLGDARRAVRHLGLGWAARRVGYAARVRLGVLERRTPVAGWDAFALDRVAAEPGAVSGESLLEARRSGKVPFLWTPGELTSVRERAAKWPGDDARREVESLRAGRLRLFGGAEAEVGFPPDWHRDPVTGARYPENVHWSRIGDFERGDVKRVWEAARFGFVYPLVRWHARSGDPACAETFWRLVESFRDANPPNAGVHWKCGQESSLRLMAWCFGLQLVPRRAGDDPGPRGGPRGDGGGDRGPGRGEPRLRPGSAEQPRD